MDHARTDRPADQPLRQALSLLAPELKGFPVDELLDVYMSAQPPERAHAYDVVDRCLDHWIASLEATIRDYPGDPIDELARVRCRQSGARDALKRLRTTLTRVQDSGFAPLN